MPQKDSWTTDILTAGIGVAIGFTVSIAMPRASAGSFVVAKAIVELGAMFVVIHYVRCFVQKIPLLGEIFGPMFYALQLLTAFVVSAGLAINYFPG